MADPNDHLNDLLAAVGARDVAAFRALYDVSLPRLRALARRWTSSADLADDVLQLAYVRIWEQAPNRDHTRGSAIGWMLRLCRNVALDELRRRKAQRVRDTRYAEASSDESVVTDDPSAFHQLVAGLSAEEQGLLSAVYVDGWTHTEVAARTGKPLGTTKSQIRRALGKLRIGQMDSP